MSCGWCFIDVQDLQRGMAMDLPIKGGNPQAEMAISQDDVRAERSGINAIKKVFAGGTVDKRLKVQITTMIKMPPEVRYHITMMPSTCLVQRSLLNFVSAYMNYKAKKLLEEQVGGVFRKPSGDVVISCFPFVFDCPDIVEILATIWREDVEPEMRKAKA